VMDGADLYDYGATYRRIRNSGVLRKLKVMGPMIRGFLVSAPAPA
jgi:hypothetical protein